MNISKLHEHGLSLSRSRRQDRWVRKGKSLASWSVRHRIQTWILLELLPVNNGIVAEDLKTMPPQVLLTAPNAKTKPMERHICATDILPVCWSSGRWEPPNGNHRIESNLQIQCVKNNRFLGDFSPKTHSLHLDQTCWCQRCERSLRTTSYAMRLHLSGIFSGFGSHRDHPIETTHLKAMDIHHGCCIGLSDWKHDQKHVVLEPAVYSMMVNIRLICSL